MRKVRRAGRRIHFSWCHLRDPPRQCVFGAGQIVRTPACVFRSSPRSANRCQACQSEHPRVWCTQQRQRGGLAPAPRSLSSVLHASRTVFSPPVHPSATLINCRAKTTYRTTHSEGTTLPHAGGGDLLTKVVVYGNFSTSDGCRGWNFVWANTLMRGHGGAYAPW